MKFKSYIEFVNESKSNETAMILSRDEDLDRIKKIIRNDPDCKNLRFAKWEKSQPLGSIRGTLFTMWFDNTKDEISKFIKKHNIKIANPSNFDL